MGVLLGRVCHSGSVLARGTNTTIPNERSQIVHHYHTAVQNVTTAWVDAVGVIVVRRQYASGEPEGRDWTAVTYVRRHRGSER